MVHYRRNADTQLRDLEHQLASDTGNKELLKRVDTIRYRNGMPPHPQTRLRVAYDRLNETNYQGFMLLKEFSSALDEIFRVSWEVRLNPELFNDRQYQQ